MTNASPVIGDVPITLFGIPDALRTHEFIQRTFVYSLVQCTWRPRGPSPWHTPKKQIKITALNLGYKKPNSTRL